MKGFSNTICVTLMNKNVQNVCKHTFARFAWALRAQPVCDVDQQIQGLTHSSKRTHGVLAYVVCRVRFRGLFKYNLCDVDQHIQDWEGTRLTHT